MKDLKEELKKAEEKPSNPPAPEDETNTDSPEVVKDDLKNTGDEVSPKENEDGNDEYEAELSRLTQERDNYKEGLLNAKDKLKRHKVVPDLDEETIAERIKADVLAELEDKDKAREIDRQSDYINEILDKVAISDSEKKLIKYHYENSIKQSGFTRAAILADIENAKILANREKLIRENEELSESLKSYSSRGNQNFSGQKIRSTEKEPPLTEADKKLLNAFGKFGAAERYKKEFNK